MDARAGLLGLSLIAVTLAGCIGGTEDEAQEQAGIGPVDDVLHELKELVNVEVAMPDGLVARGTVYLPDVDEDEKIPTVLELSPYFTAGTDIYGERDKPPSLLYYHFLQRGYAIAYFSVRGTGLSEGCFKVGGHEEWGDAAAIVEGLAEQPWSDGTVAMSGISYPGTTPWEAAVMAPPSLKAIVPVEGITDMYNYSYFEGAPIWGAPLFHTRYPVSSTDYLYFGDDVATHARNQPTNVCTEYAEGSAADIQTYIDGVHGAFWDERHVTPAFDNIEAATLVVHGFQDWNVKMDHVQHIWPHLPEPKAMLLGQWQHNVPWRNTFDEDWSIPWYNQTVQDWLDAYVLEDPGALARAEAFGPVAFQDSRGEWYNISAWPPADQTWTVEHLAEDGTMSTEPAGDGAIAFRSRPLDGDFAFGLVESPVPGDGAVFGSESPTEPVWFVGNPAVELTVSVELPTGGFLNAYLYDVSDDERFFVTKGHLSLAQRDGRDQEVDVPTGTPMDVRIPMYAIAHVVEPGHHLELVIASEDHAGPPTSYRQQSFTLHVGDGTTSALHLPGWQPPSEAPAASEAP